MVRVCDGETLPRADKSKTYLLRTLGNLAHEIWDVTDPAKPRPARHGARRAQAHAQELVGVRHRHRLPGLGRRAVRLAHQPHDEDLRPGRSGAAALHPRLRPARAGAGLDRRGARGRARAHRAAEPRLLRYGTGAEGVLQIVDREKLLAGNPQAADGSRRPLENLLYPQIGRLDMSPAGAGTPSFPILGVSVPHWSPAIAGPHARLRLLVSESLRNECQEIRQLSFMVDVTTERTPYSVATFEVPDPTGDFCRRGGRFGPHSSNESFTPDLLRTPRVHRLLQRGRAGGGRPRSVPPDARPASTFRRSPPRPTSAASRWRARRAARPRSRPTTWTWTTAASSTSADRADTGLHIVELTGPARAIANFTK